MIDDTRHPSRVFSFGVNADKRDMEWDEIGNEKSTAAQRQSLYRALKVSRRNLEALLRGFTKDEASQMLDILIRSAERRRKQRGNGEAMPRGVPVPQGA
jgi:hypothetical protein